jgi:hypothetical protein
MLEDKLKKQLETLSVEMLIAFRGAYLREQSGRPPLNYWSQLQDRVRAAARQTTSASEWASQVQRRLQIPSLSKDYCQVLIDLTQFCDEHQAHTEFLDMIERDHALLMALTQLTIDKRKEAV